MSRERKVRRPAYKRMNGNNSLLVGVLLDEETLALLDARVRRLRETEGVVVSRANVIRGLIRSSQAPGAAKETK